MMAGWRKVASALVAATGVGAGAVVYNFERQPVPVHAGDLMLHPPHQHWHHRKMFGSFDVQSLRRGYLVYKNVCKACHSLNDLAFREMVGVFMTEEEVKAEAAEVEIMDGPDETGEMFERPGKLADKLPAPYRNDEEAKFANNGALPPDLSQVVYAREAQEDYIFALLTGYCDPPAGYDLKEGLHYNPYFLGGSIAMAQALYPGIYEYPDGTPASVPQMAKDVTEFLSWVSQPEMQTRNEMGIKFFMLLMIAIPACYWWKRHKWAPLKNQKIEFRQPPPATRDQMGSATSLRFRRGAPKH